MGYDSSRQLSNGQVFFKKIVKLFFSGIFLSWYINFIVKGRSVVASRKMRMRKGKVQ